MHVASCNTNFYQLIVGVAQAARFRCGVAMAMCMDYEGREVRGMEAGQRGREEDLYIVDTLDFIKDSIPTYN